jgi:predicted AlkP superfamily phosphohydrolase/phosphomutase
MRFLRMLTNSVIAGLLGAAYLTVLVLQLNPQVPLASATTWRWFAMLAASYGVHLAVLFYVLMVTREFFSLDVLSPAWVSVRVLAWLAAGVSSVAAVLMWLNVRGFAAALDAVTARRMTAGAIAAAVSAIVLLGIAIAHYSSGRRGGRVGAALFTIAVIGSIALPVAARGPAVQLSLSSHPVHLGVRPARPPSPRVFLLLFDGASLEYIWTRAAEGRLPNFARLIESGAAIDLATIRPTQPDPVWAAVATGMYPAKNGVRSAASYYAWGDNRPIDLLPDHCFSHALVSLGVVRHVANSSAAWRARPLWSILADAGVSVGIVRWPLTYPAPPVLGFMVADRFHEMIGSVGEFDDRAAYPPNVVPIARDAFSSDGPSGQAAAAAGTAGTAEESASFRDRSYYRVMQSLRGREYPQVIALRYQGLDSVGHRHWSAAEPRSARDGSEAERRRSEQALERAYLAVDAEVGTAIQALAPGDLLLAVGGFGMQRLNPVKGLLGRLTGEGVVSGTHERAPDGFLLAYGTAVETGRRQRGAIVDVAPTVLYYLGLPVGRDMDGYARSDLFTAAFTAERPIAFIPTHNR